MNSRVLKVWNEHPFALLTELGIFLAFFISLYVMANLETLVSMWAMVPHVLCNLSLVALIVRHRVLGRPAMYWSHFDFIVVLLFIYFAANVYYSEIRAISWQTCALYMDSLAAYFMGRMMFYHRVRAYALVMTAALVIAWLGVYMNAYQARQAEKSYHAQATELEKAPPAGMDAADVQANADVLYKKADYQDAVARRYAPVQHLYLMLIAFWALSLVFLWLESPASLAFLVYGAGVVGLYVFYSLGKAAWALGTSDTLEQINLRNDKFESLRTALEIIKSYPITGGGLGTFPALFDSYRMTPAASLGTGFNGFVFMAVETGIIGVLLILYFFVRMPLHAITRWKMIPNHRLRFAIFAHIIFIALFLVESLHNGEVFQPAVWFPLWAITGTAVSLILVRDPIRVFESLLPIGRANDPEVQHRKAAYAGRGVFGRTPLAKLPRHRIPILRRLGITQTVFICLLTAAFMIITALEFAPYFGRKLATPAGADQPDLTAIKRRQLLGSQEHGEKIEQALKVFPMDANSWVARANYFEARIDDPLKIYEFSDRIEDSYGNAIKQNPYMPENYEKLYYLYRDVNRQGDALDIIQKGVQTNPNELLLRLLLIRELERLGDYPTATFHVKQSLLRIAPDETELYLRLAELYDIQGMTTDAKLYYLYAKQVVPDNAQTRARLTRLKKTLGL